MATSAGLTPGPGSSRSLAGATLEGRYRVVSQLGEGGMATVYLAEDARLPRKVVVKVPHPALLLERGFRERFEHEISSLTTLEHPHVVKVHDTGTHEGVPYAVMQHLAGGSLKDRTAEGGGRLAAGQIARWLPHVAAALDFIHRQDVVHRDVKPGNILFDRGGTCSLPTSGSRRRSAAWTPASRRPA